jgi:hypothetical protein
MYKVIKYFTDLHDNDRPYNVGDIFPRKGIAVSQERIAELASNNNKQGQPLIELVKEATEAETPKKAPAKKNAAKKTAEK